MNGGRIGRVIRFTSRRMIRRLRSWDGAFRRWVRPVSGPVRRAVARQVAFLRALARIALHRDDPALDRPAFRQPMRVALYSPSSFNTIDGSSVWLQSTARALHEDPRLGIVIPLRADDARGVFTDGLRRLDRVALVDSARFRFGAKDLPVAGVIRMLRWLDARARFDIVILRSYRVCLAAANAGAFAGRLWSAYIWEPERDARDAAYVDGMRVIARASRYVIVQTRRVGAEVERLVPEAAGKILLISPAIPSREGSPLPKPRQRLLYTGKLVPHYRFEELVSLFTTLRSDYPDLEFHVAGDKIPAQKDDPDYRRRILRLLQESPGLVWHGGIAREAVMDLLGEGGVALNVWDPAYAEGLNDLVVPSKTLEYCAAGVPAVVQRTTAHEDMLGSAYPFLVSGVADAEQAVRRLLSDEATYRDAARRARESAEAFSYESVYAGLKPALDGAVGVDTAGEARRASGAAR
ncbi:MAG: glycosyltransferase family 4 protein [Actinomycetota bacterium]